MRIHRARSARRLRQRRLIAVAAGICMILGPAAIAASPAASASAGPTLTVVSDTAFSTFNPFLAYFDGDLNVIGNIYPALTSIDEQGKPAPYLATSWTSSANKLTWTFKIRSGLKWSDGQPLTASDAAWTFNLIMKNPVAATANGALVSNFASVTAPNATTLVITTKQPEANMLYVSVPITGIPIVPEHIWDKVTNLKNFKNQSTPVVGYGPWVLTGYVTNQYATMTANQDFFMGAPKYHTLISQYFSNTDAAVAALRSGQVDQIDGITATEYKALQGSKDILAYQQAANGWEAIELNSGAKTKSGKPMGNGNPILQDARVRQAIAYAINRKVLVTKVLDGLGEPGAGYLPPAYPQFSWTPPAGTSSTFSPAKANQILDSAGYKRGPGGIRVDPRTGKQLAFHFGIHSDEITDSQIAPYIQEWLGAIGIKVIVDSMSFNELNAELPKGDFDMLMDGWGTGPDPTYLLSIQTCADLPVNPTTAGNTDSFFCNPAFDKLYNTQLTEFNQAQRASTIDQMQNILYNANADVILYYNNALGVVRTSSTKDYLYGSPNSGGFYPLQNLFINWRTAAPLNGGASSSNTGLYTGIGIAVLVLLALGIGITLRRRSTASERE